MGRKQGVKDAEPRSRRKMTDPEKARRAAKKAAEAAAHQVAERAAAERARQAFVSGMGGRQANADSVRSADSTVDEGHASTAPPAVPLSGVGGRRSGAGAAGAGGAASAAGSDNDHDADDHDDDCDGGGGARREQRPDDIEAELDDDGQLGGESGAMGTYLAAVFERLRAELSGKLPALEKTWLLDMLKAPGADWWLRAGMAGTVCARLGIEYGEPSYYRDICAWLPDERWGVEAMPPCVECESAEEVGVHGFQTKHCGRRITALTTHYFTISRRYVCGCCKRKAKEAKDAAEAAGLHVEEEDEEDAPQYTFMGYDLRSRCRLPYGYGDEYPAFHTHCSGVDNLIIDLMRPLSNKGVRFEALSATLLELHSKAYTKAYLKREQLLERNRRIDAQKTADMYSLSLIHI